MLRKIKEAYGIEDVTINIFEYKGANLSTSKVEVQGFMQKNPYKDKEYSIFYCKGADMKELITHECAHICQYEEGDLVDLDGVTYYKGSNITLCAYKYRPHEKNARRRVNKIKRIWRKE